jgi:tetratricopeptide (TPR) repeat protein
MSVGGGESSKRETPPVKQEQPSQDEIIGSKIEDTSPADTTQIMVMRMLEFALNDGGLSHESEIQQIKLQIENSPRPEKGNKKAARAFNDKGLASSKGRDFNNAVKMFEEANRLDKSDIEIVSNLGFSYLKQGNLDLAQQAITATLIMSPGRAAAWANLGEVFGARGDISRAIACFSNTYRFSKDRLKTHQSMKKLNETENIENVKQARAKAIDWAEKSYPNI